MSTRDFGNLLVNISIEYNDGLLVIENNNIGWGILYNNVSIGNIRTCFI